MKLIRIALLSLAAAVCVPAHAQRTPVPIVDFANIPVAESTQKPVTAEQVRAAFFRAGGSLRWDINQVADGVLEARYVKDGKHTVVAVIHYSDTKYSLTYKDSINMKYDDRAAELASTSVRAPTTQQSIQNTARANASEKQARHFASDPSSRYAVVRPVGELHPFYENWVRNLLAGVRTELKLL